MNVEDTISKYPNELAHIKVDMQNRIVEHVSENTIKEENEAMARKRSKKSSNKSKNEPKKSSKEVNFMWKCMSLGKIDISYACVGYSFSTGQPILDYSAFVDLLVNYGFAIQDVMSFIDEFAECSKEDNNAPIVMTNLNIARIMTEVEPIVKK
jgi:hypothetical protein